MDLSACDRESLVLKTAQCGPVKRRCFKLAKLKRRDQNVITQITLTNCYKFNAAQF